jgi:pimeloyl-ACP methyl ester carboxylesterase
MKTWSLALLLLSGFTGVYAQVSFNPSEVEVALASDTLYGTFLEPAKKATVAVLFIAGSGPTDRDGNIVATVKGSSTKKLAEALAENGIASVRYDKRGIGASKKAGKSEQDLRFETYVEDAIAWANWLKAKNIYKHIVIVGHSEGSLIGMIAAREAKVSAFVSLAGTGRPADVVIMEQVAKNPNNPEQIRTEIANGLENLKQGKTFTEVPAYLMSIFRPSVQPYMISWLKYDPAKEIAKLAIPVLVIQGSTDIQVSETDANLLHQAAMKHSTLAIIDGMNHVLCDAPPDPMANMATYSNPDLPLSAGLVPAITAFISKLK